MARITSYCVVAVAIGVLVAASIRRPNTLPWPAFPWTLGAYFASFCTFLASPPKYVFLADLALHATTGALYWTSSLSGDRLLEAAATALIVHHIFIGFAIKPYLTGTGNRDGNRRG